MQGDFLGALTILVAIAITGVVVIPLARYLDKRKFSKLGGMATA